MRSIKHIGVKSIAVKYIAAALTLSVLLSLAACGGKSALSGVYVIKDITDDPDGMTYAEMETMYKEMNLNIQDFIRFEFTKDGSFTLLMFGDAESGTYKKDGKTLTLTFNDGKPGAASASASSSASTKSALSASAAFSSAASASSPARTSTAAISGDKISWTYQSGAKLVFEKSK